MKPVNKVPTVTAATTVEVRSEDVILTLGKRKPWGITSQVDVVLTALLLIEINPTFGARYGGFACKENDKGYII